MRPTVAQVANARYWLGAAIRLIAVGLAVFWIARYAGDIFWALAYTRNASYLTQQPFFLGLGLLVAASLLMLLRSFLVGWLLPLPKGGCPKCGYPTTVEAGRCPECGLSSRDPQPT